MSLCIKAASGMGGHSYRCKVAKVRSLGENGVTAPPHAAPHELHASQHHGTTAPHATDKLALSIK